MHAIDSVGTSAAQNQPPSEHIPQGVKTSIEGLIHNLTPSPASEETLANETVSSLRKFFQQADHSPSAAMWEALSDLAVIMARMANETCPSRFYLSSLDPGVGKTQTIIHFVQTLLSSPLHTGVGVILCVSRLDEIKSLVLEMGLDQGDFSVLTSDKSLNALGTPRANKAQVLITTQQMIESRCEGRLFGDVTEFYYHDKPRIVRIWDEAILPGQTLTLNRDDIGFLFKPLRMVYPGVADKLEDLFTSLRDIQDGETTSIPDFVFEFGVDLNDVLRLIDDATQAQKSSTASLWYLSGKTATVRRDGALGNTILDYRETLPEDLAPMVILDASGRVRTTYSHWEESRGGLVRLKTATKKYDNLTVHCWTTGGGKSAFKKNRSDLLDGIASTINTKPNEEWLVIHHRNQAGADFKRDLISLLKTNGSNVSFTNWGRHHATNQYGHIPNVILAGTLFYRPSYYESLGRLSKGLPSGAGSLSKDDFRSVEIGEHRHLILQALCRGAVRKCQGDHCAPCNAYIIANSASGIPNAISDTFPGCKVKPWRPIRKALKGKIKEAAEVIGKHLSEHPKGFLKFKEVQVAIGVTDGKNFRKNVRRHPDFIEEMASQGIIEHGDGKYPTGFVKAVSYGYNGNPVDDF